MIKDETGNIYGLLTVLNLSHIHKKDGAYWNCSCECGNLNKVLGGVLRRGHAKSCGCVKKKPEGESSFKAVVRSYKRHAKDRGYLWQLTDEDVKSLTKAACHYCGLPPSNVKEAKRANGSYIYSGIDRIDNTVGYAIDNVVSCCKYCNSAKSDRSYDEYLSWLLKSYNHITGNN